MLIVFGSVNADLLFKVETLPRPGETVLCPDYAFAPGGKGSNQAAAAAKAGAQTLFVGHLGDDAYGPIVRNLLVDAGIDCNHLAISDKPTAIAVIGVDDAGENSIIVASGANLATNTGQLSEGLLQTGSTLLCQNEITKAENFKALKLGRECGATTLLNLAPASPVPDDVLECVDYLVVNEIEVEMLAGAGLPPLDAAKQLVARFGLTCVVTLGAQGTIAVSPNGSWQVGTLSVEAVDTTGAGDAFVGVLAACLDEGMAFEQCLKRASVGAALACEKIGAQTSQPDRKTIEERLSELADPKRL